MEFTYSPTHEVELEIPWQDVTKGQSKMAAALTARGRRLWDDETPRRDEISRNLKRVTRRALQGGLVSGQYSSDADNYRLNISKSAVDTLVSKVGSSKPRPRIVTNGANYEIRERARQLQRFLDAVHSSQGVQETAKRAFRDSLVCDGGIVHAYGDAAKGVVRVERVFPSEVLIDPIGGANGEPMELIRTKLVAREVLMAIVEPGRKAAVAALPCVSYEEIPDYQREAIDGTSAVSPSSRMIRVYEGWTKATYTYDGEKVCGRHRMAAGDVLLFDREWEHDCFPFAFYHFNMPMVSFWGESAVGEIRGTESEANRLLQKVQAAMQLAGQPWVLRHIDDAGLPKITDQVGLEVLYKNPATKPEIVAHSPVAPQLMQQVLQLRSLCFEQLGTNDSQVAALKPAGIESGRGLEQLAEDHLVRFKDAAQRFEWFVAHDITRIIMRAADDLDDLLKARGRGGLTVRGKVEEEHVKVSWEEAEIEEDSFAVDVFPTSGLPLTPSARSEEVQRLMDSGLIDQTTALRLLDMPDLDEERSMLTADEDFIEWQLCQMLENGKPVQPTERQNLQNAAKRGTFAYLRAVRQGVAPKRLRLLDDFLTNVFDLLQPPPEPQPLEAPMAADPMMGGAPAPMDPMAAPPGLPAPGMPGPGMSPPEGLPPGM